MFSDVSENVTHKKADSMSSKQVSEHMNIFSCLNVVFSNYHYKKEAYGFSLTRQFLDLCLTDWRVVKISCRIPHEERAELE